MRIENHTIEDILRFALARIAFSEKIYRRLADAVEDTATSAIFLALAQAEQRQRENIELELYKIGLPVSHSPLSAPPDKEEWPNWKFLARRMLIQDAFELAIHRQEESFRLFAEWLGKTTHPRIADVLFQLCREEVRHLVRLENEFQSISPKQGA